MRKAIKAYLKGWSDLLISKSLWLWLYLFNIVFALVITLPFNAHLKKNVGHSLSFIRSIGDFDFTFIGDFLNEYGQGFNLILNMSKWVLVLYLFFSIFLSGGILQHFKDRIQSFKIGLFTQSGGIFFWRLFGLAVVFSILHLILFILFWFIFQSLMGGLSPFKMESDVQLRNTFLIVFSIYSFFMVFLFLIHDYAKVILIHNHHRFFFQSIPQAFSLVFKNFKACFLLYLFNGFTFLFLFFLYQFLKKWIPTDQFGLILLVFFMGQFFLFMRIGLKMLNLASAISLYRRLQSNY